MRQDVRVTWHFNTKILFAAKFCSQCRAPGLELQHRNPGLQCLCCWGQKICPEISPGKCHSDGMTWRPWVCAKSKMAEQNVGGVNTECRWGWMMLCFPKPGVQHKIPEGKITCICFASKGRQIFFGCHQALIDMQLNQMGILYDEHAE